MAIRTARLYRTVGYHPATVVAGYPPLLMTVTADAVLRARMRTDPKLLPVQITIEPDEPASTLKNEMGKAVEREWNEKYQTSSRNK